MKGVVNWKHLVSRRVSMTSLSSSGLICRRASSALVATNSGHHNLACQLSAITAAFCRLFGGRVAAPSPTFERILKRIIRHKNLFDAAEFYRYGQAARHRAFAAFPLADFRARLPESCP